MITFPARHSETRNQPSVVGWLRPMNHPWRLPAPRGARLTTIAVGFSPRVEIRVEDRAAERRLNPTPPQASLCDARVLNHGIRGLKATAFLMRSLRDPAGPKN